MRDDRGAASVPLQQTTPLVHQHRWHDQRERLAEREGDCERDVRLAEADGVREQRAPVAPEDADEPLGGGDLVRGEPCRPWRDRKSTRLNSSHSQISYAVFCLKKKKKKREKTQ